MMKRNTKFVNTSIRISKPPGTRKVLPKGAGIVLYWKKQLVIPITHISLRKYTTNPPTP